LYKYGLAFDILEQTRTDSFCVIFTLLLLAKNTKLEK